MNTGNSLSQARSRRIALAGTLAGSTVEWYDFFIFGIISALFVNKLFFPTLDPVTGTILGFMTFASAWIVRPIGGVIAGHFGDRIGRKTTLLWSFVLMGTATTAIGFLPTYRSAGLVAAVLRFCCASCRACPRAPNTRARSSRWSSTRTKRSAGSMAARRRSARSSACCSATSRSSR